MNGLNEKVAIVTGATQGIGYGIAARLAGEGMTVVVTSRDAEKAQQTADSLMATGGSALGLGVQVNEPDSVSQMYEHVMKEYGAVHVLVNNAAAVRDTLLLRMKRVDWDEVIAVNLGAVFQCTQGVTRIMMKQRYGRIINLTSIVGVIGNAGQANYAASKAGIIGFTKSVARELGSRGVTVNAVAPGFIETPMTADLPDQIRAGFVDGTPLGRPGDSEDVSGAVAFLASDDASFITGQVLHVDGGMVM